MELKDLKDGDLFDFGAFRIDVGRRLLLRDGEPVPLTAKAFDTLLTLVRRRGEVVEKSDLMTALWPDSYVEEANLTQNVSTVRKALGETRHEHRYIVTIPGRGYQFVAPVQVTSDLPAAPVATEDVEVPATARDAEPRVPARSRSFRAAAVTVTAICALAALGLWLLVPNGGHGDAPERVTLSRLTTTGRVTAAALSPDGRFLVYAEEEGGKQGLRVRQLAAGNDVQVEAPGRFGYNGLTFSRDGDFVYCVRAAQNSPSVLVRLPMLGGAPVEISRDVDSPVTLSPDETRIAFARGYPERGLTALVVANADGTDETELALLVSPVSMFVGPSWSPDGRRIAWVASPKDAGGPPRLATVRVDDGAVEPITSPSWRQIGRIAWVADGSGLVVTAAAEEAPAGAQVWLVAYPSGGARRLTNDLEDYRAVSVANDGRTLVAIQVTQEASLWVVPEGGSGRAAQVTAGSYDGLDGVAWTPDGGLVFTSRSGDAEHLWVVDRDGRNRRELTTGDGPDTQPAVSPDGRSVAFVSGRDGARCIWRVDLAGGRPIRLTSGPADSGPAFSPDGTWIYYTSRVSGRPNVARVPFEGGDPAQLTDRIVARLTVSPVDGRIAACYRYEPLGAYHLVLLAADGGEPIADFGPIIPAVTPKWTVDGGAVSCVLPGDPSNVSSQPVEGGPPRRVTAFESDRIFAFAWSPDGKSLACVRGTRTRDAVLIRRSGDGGADSFPR